MLKAVPLFQLKYWSQSTIHSLYFKRFHWYLLEGRRPGPRWERSWMCWCQFSFPIGKTREGLGKFALRIGWGFLCRGVDRGCCWGQMTNRWVSAATSQHSPQFCTFCHPLCRTWHFSVKCKWWRFIITASNEHGMKQRKCLLISLPA